MEQNCNSDGDYVSDTPIQRDPSFYCPKEPYDTCPNSPGKDSTFSHMDYAYSDCGLSFTPGQITRMREMTLRYRAGK